MSLGQYYNDYQQSPNLVYNDKNILGVSPKPSTYKYQEVPENTINYSYSFRDSKNRASSIAKDLLTLAEFNSNKASNSPVYDSYSNRYTSSVTPIPVPAPIPDYSGVYLSEIEAAILRSYNPIEVSESQEISVLGNRGLWLNRSEANNWRGDISIDRYLINEDSNPQIISKKVQQNLEYVQELAIRYLRPPTPPAPGEIIIKQLQNISTAPAPPLIIRQVPPRLATPEPLIIREAPPQKPQQIDRKIITIPGNRIPPPPRKLVVERLPQLPSKPASVFVERWLPYAEVKRKVIYQPNEVPDPVVVKPKNVIVQWQAPNVVVRKNIKYLGVSRTDPVEYVSRYGSTLVSANNMPREAFEFRTPNNFVLAADYKHKQYHDLEGDLHALNMIDLDKEGLGHYKNYLGVSKNTYLNNNLQSNYLSSKQRNLSILIEQLFREIDYNNSGKITLEEAERIVLRLNSRLNRSYGENEVRAFFSRIDLNKTGKISLDEFRTAFLIIIPMK